MWWPRRRQRPVHAPRRSSSAWADLTRPAPDPDGDDRAAVLAAALRTEAERLGQVLDEPTVLLHDTVRVPGYLAAGAEGDW